MAQIHFISKHEELLQPAHYHDITELLLQTVTTMETALSQ
jgi:hypothetical protein